MNPTLDPGPTRRPHEPISDPRNPEDHRKPRHHQLCGGLLSSKTFP